MQETWVWSLSWEDPLEEEMATHSSILAWKIPWTEEPGRLQSIGLQRVWHNLATETSMLLLLLSCFSCVWLFATLWTVAYQAPPSMGFSRQEYRNELPFPSPGIFQTQGLNLALLYCRQRLYCLSHQGSRGCTINLKFVMTPWSIFTWLSLYEVLGTQEKCEENAWMNWFHSWGK